MMLAIKMDLVMDPTMVELMVQQMAPRKDPMMVHWEKMPLAIKILRKTVLTMETPKAELMVRPIVQQ